MGIYILRSDNISVNTTTYNPYIALNSSYVSKLIPGMQLVVVSGSNPFYTETYIEHVGSAGVYLTKYPAYASTVTIYFDTIELNSISQSDLLTTSTDVIYPSGFLAGPIAYFNGSSWNKSGYSLIAGRLYKVMSYGGSGQLSQLGTVTLSNLLTSNGVQPSTIGMTIKVVQIISTSFNKTITRASEYNTYVYDDREEVLLPIYIGGGTTSYYQLRLTNINSIIKTTPRYVLTGGSTVTWAYIKNLIRRSDSIDNRPSNCIISMMGAGGGGGGGCNGSYGGPGGGGSGSIAIIKTSVPALWPSVVVPSGGFGRAINDSSNAGNGGNFSFTAGGKTFTVAGGKGATWSGYNGIGGVGGTVTFPDSQTIGLGIYIEPLVGLDGGAGGDKQESGENAGSISDSIGFGAGVDISIPDYLGNYLFNGSFDAVYYLYGLALGKINDGLDQSFSGGISGGNAGHGGGGAASHFYNGGRGATTTIASEAGNYGSGGGGGRSAFLSGERQAGSNGGTGVFTIFA